MQIKTIKNPTDEQRNEYRKYHREMNDKLVKVYDFTMKARQTMDKMYDAKLFEVGATYPGEITPKCNFNGQLLTYKDVCKDSRWITELHTTFRHYYFPPDTNPETMGFAYLDQSDLKKLNRLWRRYSLEHLV